MMREPGADSRGKSGLASMIALFAAPTVVGQLRRSSSERTGSVIRSNRAWKHGSLKLCSSAMLQSLITPKVGMYPAGPLTLGPRAGRSCTSCANGGWTGCGTGCGGGMAAGWGAAATPRAPGENCGDGGAAWNWGAGTGAWSSSESELPEKCSSSSPMSSG
jgi:hypothetical protein